MKSRISSASRGRRNDVTPEERDKIIERYFPEGINGPLKEVSMREKSRIVVLEQLAGRFQKDKTYSEKEVNEILKKVSPDYVTLRRYLIEYGFMERKKDGSEYWIKKNEDDNKEALSLDRKKELKNQYKEIKTEAGIYQIRNTINGKVFLVSTPNLKTINGREIELNNGTHRNKLLQDEWKQYGKDAFVFEVLEILEPPEEGYFDTKEELKKLEKKWMEKLQPYGDKGYHKI